MKIIHTIALAGLAASLGTTAYGKDMMVGRWKVMSDVSTNGSPYCSMHVGPDEDGFGLQVTADGMTYLIVAHPEWPYTGRQSVPVKYAIDSTPTWEGSATAVAPGVLINGMPGDADVVGIIARAKTLAVTAGDNKAVEIDLGGGADASAVLRECMAAFPSKK